MYIQKPIPSVPALTLYVLDLLLLSPVLLAQQVCYWPDGTEATSHIPCNSSASNTPTDASSCCHDLAVSYCQDNNLCTWNGVMYRGACTDKTWRSPNCPQQCTDVQRDTGMNIFPCPMVGVWQCERAGQCSTNFTLPPFGILLRDSQLPGNPKEGIGLATDPHPSSSSSSSSSSISTPAAAAAAVAAVTVTTTPNITKSKHPLALAIGLGLGLPLGLLVLIACTIVSVQWRQRQRERKLKELSSSSNIIGDVYEKKMSTDNYDKKNNNNNNKEKRKRKRRWFPFGVHHVHAQELPEQRAVPELRDKRVESVHELGEGGSGAQLWT